MRRAAAATSFALFVVLALLVEHGTFHALDQHAIRHWMPWLEPHHHAAIDVGALFVPETRHTLAGTLVILWTYPASVLVSAVLVGIAAWKARSWRLPALWVAANAVDVVGKHVFHRPPLLFHGKVVTAFGHSLPSGHTLRAFVVAYAFAEAWRRGRAAYAWALLVPVALVLAGDHTPTDVLAGALAAGGLLLGM